MKEQLINILLKIVLLLPLSLLPLKMGWAATHYVDSAGGNNSNTGTISAPFETVSRALEESNPGDFIRLMPGTHNGRITITKSGDTDKPITIISHSENPDQFAVIDSGATVSNTGRFGFKLKNCKWITIENLKFRNCWKEIIEIDNSSYITIRANDFREGRRVVYPYGTGSHHILVENNFWEQDKRIWTTWDWATVHDEYIYSGALYGTKTGEQGYGASVIRNNHIKYAFNCIWMRSAAMNRQANNEIYGNIMEYVRDNAVEPEDRTFNLHIYHNVFNQVSNGIFSIQGVAGGPIYLYGNVGYYDFDDPPHQSGTRGKPNWRVFKMSNSDDSKLNDTLHTYHNTWYYGSLTTDSGKSNRHWHHYNNIGVFKSGYQLSNYQFDSWDNDFDHDYSDKAWPSSINNSNEEQNGVANAGLPSLMDPESGDYRVNSDSRLIDRGKIIDGFTQSYEGSAPDLGAYEGDRLVEGPPFYIQIPSGGLGYVEKPRITRHRINDNELKIFWSWPLNPTSISKDTISLIVDGSPVELNNLRMGSSNREVILTSSVSLENKELSLDFITTPVGDNGEKATLWANTLCERRLVDHSYQPSSTDVSSIASPENLRVIIN